MPRAIPKIEHLNNVDDRAQVPQICFLAGFSAGTDVALVAQCPPQGAPKTRMQY